MYTEIRHDPFNPWQVLDNYAPAKAMKSGSYGATAVFVGTMRDINEERSVQAMELEHYPGMTDKYLQRISAQAAKQWPILDSVIVHRVGTLQPDDPIVLVAVWSAHRAVAFDACRFLIEQLKSKAPFWKKETLESGEAKWVEKNT